MSILARAAAQRSDSERQSRAVEWHLPGPPAFRTAWVKSFSSELAIFLLSFSFSFLVSAPARSISFSCVAKFLASVSEWASRQSRHEPSELVATFRHPVIALGGQNHQ